MVKYRIVRNEQARLDALVASPTLVNDCAICEVSSRLYVSEVLCCITRA